MVDERKIRTDLSRPFSELCDHIPAIVLARVDARVERTLTRMALADIRRAVGETQVAMAKSLGVGKASVSKLESSADMYLSTLRCHVAAFGGELELTVCLPGAKPIAIERLSAAGKRAVSVRRGSRGRAKSAASRGAGARARRERGR